MPGKDGKRRVREAALELFAAKGVRGASTREIARRAGLAEGTIYRHFDGKEALAAEVFLEAAGALRSRLERELEGTRGAEEALRRLVRGFFGFAGDEPARWRCIADDHPSLRRIPPGTRLPKDVVLEVVRRGIREKGWQVRDPVLAAAMIIGTVTRALFFLGEGLLSGPREELAEKTATLLLHGLRKGEAERRKGGKGNEGDRVPRQ
ncbi:MAG: hypothetical protein KatS3mg076_2567 [Candidatus Binatia bacterium]|nr:MAG: hypothetical protein KatS3mg076_2567 [Candidatus Binatia bacterium]